MNVSADYGTAEVIFRAEGPLTGREGRERLKQAFLSIPGVTHASVVPVFGFPCWENAVAACSSWDVSLAAVGAAAWEALHRMIPQARLEDAPWLEQEAGQ